MMLAVPANWPKMTVLACYQIKTASHVIFRCSQERRSLIPVIESSLMKKKTNKTFSRFHKSMFDGTNTPTEKTELPPEYQTDTMTA